MTDFPQEQRHILPRVSPQDWIVAIAAALLALMLLGVLPRLFW